MPQDRRIAEAVMLGRGWLANQPPPFQREALSRCLVQTFSPGDVVYRIGDPPGGIYGLVGGTLAINLAPPHSTPRFVQFGIVGAWAGERSFLTGEPRRVEMKAVTSCTMMHLPLNAMQQMAARDPEAIRCFARITVMHFDVLERVIDDLLIPQADRRIAAVLQRASWLQSRTIPISQADLGMKANASRKQVNAALARFAANGWVTHSYRVIEVLDGDALLKFASGEAG